MQFKYPELLWALFLLLIPIVIHLFQLRKFKITPFTNVALLKKVQTESRKTKNLKKWLLLFTRLALFAALIIAFAQPFFASKTALQPKETCIYLDNSFSTQLKVENSTLLQNAVQDLIKTIPQNEPFTLFTNNQVLKATNIAEIQNTLLNLPHSQKQLTLPNIILKANTLFTPNNQTKKNLIVISDFQKRMVAQSVDSLKNSKLHVVQLPTNNAKNIAIDTVFITKNDTQNIELTTQLSANYTAKSVSVSLFNGEKLIAKSAAIFTDKNSAEITFTIPANEPLQGKIVIQDNGLPYDNVFYLTVNQNEKINVLAVSEGDASFLKRIYTDDEFNFSTYTLKNLKYNQLNNQNLVVLHNLASLPTALTTSLKTYIKNGGHLVIIPSEAIDVANYNPFLKLTLNTSITQKINNASDVTGITFSHPLYKNVFTKNVTNFEYPSVQTYYTIKTNVAAALQLQNKAPFLISEKSVSLFTASLESENSNFKNSPLIVPSLYNLALQSLQLPQLYQTIGKDQNIEIAHQLRTDNVLKLEGNNTSIIPQQQIFSNKVVLNFTDNVVNDGNYTLFDAQTAIKNLSFNYPRAESNLTYINIDDLQASSKLSSVSSLFNNLQKNNVVNALWKWFVILALLFLIIEISIQKFIK